MKNDNVKIEDFVYEENIYFFVVLLKKKKFGNKISAYFKHDMKETNSIVFVPGEYRISSKTERFIARDLEWFKRNRNRISESLCFR